MHIEIDEDNIDYKSSKWLLEYALTCGYDTFSFDLESLPSDYSKKRQKELINELSSNYLGMKLLDKFVLYNDEESPLKQNVWSLDYGSINVILAFMGRHLLDVDVAINIGLSGWRFYNKTEVMAVAVYGFDYFVFTNAPNSLVKKLENKISVQ